MCGEEPEYAVLPVSNAMPGSMSLYPGKSHSGEVHAHVFMPASTPMCLMCVTGTGEMVGKMYAHSQQYRSSE